MRLLLNFLKNNLTTIKTLNRQLIINRSMAKLIDGKKLAKEIEDELKVEIKDYTEKGNAAPCLKVILVGDDPASCKYIEKKMDSAKYVGINSETIVLPCTTDENTLIEKIKELNKDKSVHGILVQLPLPDHISERLVCNSVREDKDVDGFHSNNIGKLCLNVDTFVSCTALGVIELIKRTGIQTFGKKAVVCGRSKNVGLPISLLLQSDYRNELSGLEATTTMCHRNTLPQDLQECTKTADIVISATGVVGLIKAEMIKPGATVIDVGCKRITREDGKTKLVGDVDFEGVSKVAGLITPVPGGVGPMTVAMLMKNTFKAAVLLQKVQ